MISDTTLQDVATPDEDGAPLFLWIDGVGGYLVCRSHRLTMGQANPASGVDIALLADVSRHHATLQRDGEAYCIEAVRDVAVNGKPVTRAVLRSGDRLTLAQSCQLQFWQSVPLSGSARLDVVSGHRYLHPVEAVLLMSDTLVLGAGPQAHVQVADLPQNLVLYRGKTGLGIRWPGNLHIGGQVFANKASIRAGDSVATEHLTLALEAVQRNGR